MLRDQRLRRVISVTLVKLVAIILLDSCYILSWTIVGCSEFSVEPGCVQLWLSTYTTLLRSLWRTPVLCIFRWLLLVAL